MSTTRTQATTRDRPIRSVRRGTHEQTGTGIIERITHLPPDAHAWDPFLLLGEDRFERGAFSWHPHRGFDTVTYVIDGKLRHRDAWGTTGVIGPGDVQWTTAGSGILHDEEPVTSQVHGLQLWLNLPAAKKMSPPTYRELHGPDMPKWRAPGFEGHVFAGTLSGITGPHEPHAPASLMDLNAESGHNATLELAPEQAYAVLVLQGAISLNDQPVDEGCTAWLPTSTATELRIETHATSHVLIYGGAPIQEPVVLRFPFAMNTQEEIQQAIKDAQTGAFGKIPEPKHT